MVWGGESDVESIPGGSLRRVGWMVGRVEEMYGSLRMVRFGGLKRYAPGTLDQGAVRKWGEKVIERGEKLRSDARGESFAAGGSVQ